MDRLYTGTTCLEGLPSDTIARFHTKPHMVPVDEVPFGEPPPRLRPNQYLVMCNGSLSALAARREEGACRS